MTPEEEARQLIDSLLDVADEPAENLLERIKAEKVKLQTDWNTIRKGTRKSKKGAK